MTEQHVSRILNGHRTATPAQQAALDTLLAVGEPFDGEQQPQFVLCADLPQGYVIYMGKGTGKTFTYVFRSLAEITQTMVAELGQIDATVVPMWRQGIAAQAAVRGLGNPPQIEELARDSPETAQRMAQHVLDVIADARSMTAAAND